MRDIRLRGEKWGKRGMSMRHKTLPHFSRSINVLKVKVGVPLKKKKFKRSFFNVLVVLLRDSRQFSNFQSNSRRNKLSWRPHRAFSFFDKMKCSELQPAGKFSDLIYYFSNLRAKSTFTYDLAWNLFRYARDKSPFAIRGPARWLSKLYKRRSTIFPL